MAAVAAYKEIDAEKLRVQIHRQTVEGAPWQTAFAIELDLGDGLSRRERTILFNSARRCEVHKLLTGEMDFEYRLAGQAREQHKAAGTRRR
jgi:uncharacterized OsmC-like protein